MAMLQRMPNIIMKAFFLFLRIFSVALYTCSVWLSEMFSLAARPSFIERGGATLHFKSRKFRSFCSENQAQNGKLYRLQKNPKLY